MFPCCFLQNGPTENITKTSPEVLFDGDLYYCENQTEHMNTDCGQNAECSVLKLSVRLATALDEGLKSARFN
jgi:hypothetical protein